MSESNTVPGALLSGLLVGAALFALDPSPVASQAEIGAVGFVMGAIVYVIWGLVL